MPISADAVPVCTNMRYIDGDVPTWTDQLDPWLLGPLDLIRFVVVPLASIGGGGGLGQSRSSP